MTACEVHDTAEGVALGSIGSYVGGLAVAAGDILFNIANNAVNGQEQMLDKVGEVAAVTSVLGFFMLATSVLTMQLTRRSR